MGSFRIRSPIRKLGTADGPTTDSASRSTLTVDAAREKSDATCSASEFPALGELKLRRVFTTHACRRQRPESKLGQYRMLSLIKKPLGIAHSVPLGQMANCRYCSLYCSFHAHLQPCYIETQSNQIFWLTPFFG